MNSQQFTTNLNTLQHAIAFLITVILSSISLESFAQNVSSTTLQDNQWEQLVIPGDPGNQKISDLFGDDLNEEEYGPSGNWVIYFYDTSTSQYVDPGIDSLIKPGIAFWIIQATGDVVNIDVPFPLAEPPVQQLSQCVSSSGCFSVPLKTNSDPESWNMRGVPFPGIHSLQGFRVVTNTLQSPCIDGCELEEAEIENVVREKVWQYNSSTELYDELKSPDNMSSWQGFWVSVLDNATESEPSLLFPRRTGSYLLSGTNNPNKILRFNEVTGEFVDDFVTAESGGLNGPLGIAMSRDNKLLVSSRFTGSVLRYDGSTGDFVDVFIEAGSGGLNLPHGLTYGADNHLYVVNNTRNQVLRFNGVTGEFINAFASGGLSFPTALIFGPDGNLYVSSSFNNRVVRFDGTTGDFMDVFASGGGLSNAQGLAFGPDGNLYVGSYNGSSVLRYDGTSGAFLDVFASGGGLVQTVAVVFGPDGNLYVSGTGSANVVRYNGNTGEFIDEFVPANSGGLRGHHYLLFTSQVAGNSNMATDN